MKSTHNYNVDKLLAAESTTKKQRVAIEALKKYKTVAETARKLGVRKRTLQAMLALANKRMLAAEIDTLMPDKQVLKGTSTLYRTNEDTGEKEEVLQWVKTRQSDEDNLEAIQHVTSELVKELEGKKNPVDVEVETNDELLTVHVSTDIHLGQYSWAAGAGFRGNKQAVAVTYSKKYGEVARNVASIREVEDTVS